jgi:peptide/nickel transport system substrate-binding protein
VLGDLKLVALIRPIAVLLAVLILGVSCAPSVAREAGDAARPAPNVGPTTKRIIFGTGYEPDLRPTGAAPTRFLASVVNTGLTVLGDQRTRRPRLAEAVPSLDNGLWKLLPDERMETTWRIREGARWQDGVPLTAEDLLFSFEIGRDRDMSGFSVTAYSSIEDVQATDNRTLLVTWKEPYIDADGLLDARNGLLLPKHLLEDAYRSDKATFLDLPYWTSGFIGAGPYRLEEWIPGIGMKLGANDDFVLGRPRIDQIEVKYIPDANALTSNLLAGSVDVTHDVGSIDLAVQLRDQWREGAVLLNFGSDSLYTLFPQFIDQRPAILGDVQFRRALAYAIDRQEIVDTLEAGLSPVPHSFLSPNQAAYRDIEATTPRYEYDPRRASQILDGLGFQKGADGIYRDGSNRQLQLEVRAGESEQASKVASAVADYWHQLGIAATPLRGTSAQARDPEFFSAYPGFLLIGSSNDVGGLRFLRSSQAPLASNNFRVAGSPNRSRYMNAEFDALLDTYARTVPVPERIQAMGQVINHIADQVTLIGLYYNILAGAAAGRVANVSGDWPSYFITWNAHEWDVRN